MDELNAADQMAIWNPEEEGALIQQKCSSYERLAKQDPGEAGAHAQLRMAIIWHNGLFGHEKNKYKAISYWRALSSQVDVPSLRILGLEMLGVYYQEGWQSYGSKAEHDLVSAKQYFERANDACKDEDKETKARLRAQIKAIVSQLNPK